MRIISWFAMVCFLLEIAYSVFVVPGYGRTASVHAIVRIIPSQEKWPTQGRPSSCRSDIRKRKTGQFSRPMTGHTPQKLPPCGAISCIIAVRRIVSLYTLDYNTIPVLLCQAEIYKNFYYFRAKRRFFQPLSLLWKTDSIAVGNGFIRSDKFAECINAFPTVGKPIP